MGTVKEFDKATSIKKNAREVLSSQETFLLVAVEEDGSIGVVHSDLGEGVLDEIVEALNEYAGS